MAANTLIEWADSTANLWIGCQEVSPACDHCYARELAERYGWVEWGEDRIRCKQGWADLIKYQRAAERNGGIDPELGRTRTFFINSLSDFFDNHRSVIWRPEAWALFRKCTHLILILVTKRPQLIARQLPAFWPEIAGRVWLLTTTEDQERADFRIPHLLASTYGTAPAAIYGISAEPLLGALDLRTIYLRRDGQAPTPLSNRLGDYIRPLSGNFTDSLKLGWVIDGGETGSKARLSDPRHFRALRDQTGEAGVPYFHKHNGVYVAGLGEREGMIYPINGGDRAFAWSAKRSIDLGGGWFAERVGKPRAGSLLDGELHHAIPFRD